MQKLEKMNNFFKDCLFLQKQNILVEFNCNHNSAIIERGFILKVSKRFVLLQSIDYYFNLDGYVLLKIKDIKKYRYYNEKQSTIPTAINYMQIKKNNLDIPIKSFYNFLLNLKNILPIVEIYEENYDNEIDIGYLLEVRKNKMKVLLINPQGELDGAREFEYKDTTSISFMSGYSTNLWLFAKENINKYLLRIKPKPFSEMTINSVEELSSLQKEDTFIEFKFYDGGEASGFVLQINEEFILLESVNDSLNSKGYLFCKVKDIKTYKIHNDENSIIYTAINHKKVKKNNLDIPITSFYSFLSSLKDILPIVEINEENGDDELEIGYLLEIHKNEVKVLLITHEEELGNEKIFEYKDITSINLMGGYLKSYYLALKDKIKESLKNK